MRNHYSLLLFVILLINFQFAFSQVVINELSASNYSDAVSPEGNNTDWIELYNNGSTTIDLTDYNLTDDINNPFKFTIKSGSIAPGKFQMIYATGEDFAYKIDHWEMAIDDDDYWRFYSGSSQPDTNWRNLSFNESVWQRDHGGFGFGDGDDNTTISQTKAVFLRRTFTVADPSEIVCAVLNMDYDDGFIAYLNGVEIARSNMGSPLRRYGNDVVATKSHEAQMYSGHDPEYFYINPKKLKQLLQTGDNVLAIQVHNESSSSNDLTSNAYLSFGMKNPGQTFSNVHSWFDGDTYEVYESSFKLDRHSEHIYLYDNNGVMIDQASYTDMQRDNSLGRKPDGGGWGIFKNATPGATNNNSTLYTGYCPKPVFSQPAGFYSTSFTLNITCPLSGGTIRYTTDGSDPTSTSSQWNNSMSISSTKVIKARIYKSGYLASDIVTNTYFRNQSLKLPVFCINTDPDNLFDYNTGIYELGPNADPDNPNFGANFWQDWSRPATIEYFDKSDNQIFNVNADIKIYGNYSRSKPQKSFEVQVDKYSGTGEIVYPLLPDKPILTKFDNFVLRNSGSDWNEVHFRDAFLERAMKHTYTGYLAAEPVNVFINGSYWGVYCTYENHDHHFIENNYGYKEDQIDYLLENGNVSTKVGSKTDFMNLVSYATSANATTTSYYDKINSELDLQNFTDYMIAETYFSNQDWMGSWTNNIKIWRPAGGKWKYVLYDLDMCVGYDGSSSTVNNIAIARNPGSQNYTSDLFDAILDNPTYKKYFINRYADLINTVFQSDSLKKVEKSFKDSMSTDMTKHFAKWGGSVSSWNSKISSMESWISSRISKVRGHIQNEFNMNSQVTLTLNVSPAGAGKILISTVIPKSYPWSGVYYNGNPVTITAIANPGYTFNHWHSNVAFTSNNSNIAVTKNFTSSDAITAFFSGSAAPSPVVVSEINYNSNSSFDAGDWIELKNTSATPIDISNWVIKDGNDLHGFTVPVSTIIPANGYLVLAENVDLFQTRFPSVNNFIGPLGFSLSNSGDQIRLYDNNSSLVLNMTYDDHSPWPVEADGDGNTCEILSTGGNLSDGNNWFAGCIGGTPGRAYSAPNTNISVSGNSTICQGDSIQLSAVVHSSYTYQWLHNGVAVPGATDPDFNATASGNYSVFVSDNGCGVESSPVPITALPPASISVPANVTVCDSGQVTINAICSSVVNWYASASSTTPLFTGSSFTSALITQPTLFYAEAAGNCPSGKVPVTVNVFTSPQVNIGNDTILNSGEMLSLDAGAGYSYLWSDGSTTQTIHAMSPVNVWVTVTDSNGCSSTDTLNISTPTSISELNADGISVYPNPVNDKMFFTLNTVRDETVIIRLFDAAGRMITEQNVHGRGKLNGEMDVTDYSKGMYILSFISEHETKRFVVQITE